MNDLTYAHWTTVPSATRKLVLESIANDVRLFETEHHGDDDLVRHAAALRALLRYLREIEPTIDIELQHRVRRQPLELLREPVQVRVHVQPELPRMPRVLPALARLDPRRRAIGRDVDQQHLPGTVVLEAVLLRRAAVPAALVDALGAVPIAERQIRQPGTRDPIGGDRVRRIDILGQHTLHAAMREPDAQQLVGLLLARRILAGERLELPGAWEELSGLRAGAWVAAAAGRREAVDYNHPGGYYEWMAGLVEQLGLEPQVQVLEP